MRTDMDHDRFTVFLDLLRADLFRPQGPAFSSAYFRASRIAAYLGHDVPAHDEAARLVGVSPDHGEDVACAR